MAIISDATAAAVYKALASQGGQTAASAALNSPTSAPSDRFGPATELNLSTKAQAQITGQNSGSGSSTSNVNSSDTTSNNTPPMLKGGGAPVNVSSSTSTDSETLIEEADHQVIPKVGVTGASEVVDSKGDIDEVKLSELIAQQAQAAQNRVGQSA